ncbi:hypothetical protein [Methylomonas rivi]|uniref:Uncharacterized protein n=1 Tax=Methylomonas rivi TaxID=2952226 RepID=A0ABT1U682_9GAMM|nr:hypothetical protein [Methylomonas sp. WSC-6]MCQ8129340.1 hypothetical protein [Methylomonas sp. WSC-6]
MFIVTAADGLQGFLAVADRMLEISPDMRIMLFSTQGRHIKP